MNKINLCTPGEARGDASGSGLDSEGLRLLLFYFISPPQLLELLGKNKVCTGEEERKY